jgi:hypothetical protein
LRVHWKTDHVVRAWSFKSGAKTELPVYNKAITDHAPKDDVKAQNGFKIVELFNKYFITLKDNFKEGEKKGLTATFSTRQSTLKITMIEEKNWQNSTKVNLRTFAEKVATVNILVRQLLDQLTMIER